MIVKLLYIKSNKRDDKILLLNVLNFVLNFEISWVVFWML